MNIITWIAIALLGLSAFLAQASNTGPTSATPETRFPSRAELVEDTRTDPASDLERRVLEDGIVTPEEYEEAAGAFLVCMQTHGYEVWTEPDPYVPGVYYYLTEYVSDPSTPIATPEGTPTRQVISSDGSTGMTAEDYRYYDAFDTCSIGTTQMIEAIYVMQVVNPDDIDILELTIACLVTNDIIEPDELTAKQFDAEMRTGSPNLPFDLTDEQVTSCLANPAQNGVNGNPLVMPAATPELAPNLSPRQQLVAKAQQNPESELEERVLADGIVTNAEYEEAVSAYLACMDKAGYEMKTTPAMFMPGMYQYEFTSSDDPSTPTPDSEFEKLRAADIDCSVGTTYTIEAIYGDQIANPDDLPVMELTLTCLEEKDLLEEGSLTPAELEAALGDEHPDLPFDMWDMEVIGCLVNPSQNGLNGNPLIELTPTATAPATPAA